MSEPCVGQLPDSPRARVPPGACGKVGSDFGLGDGFRRIKVFG